MGKYQLDYKGQAQVQKFHEKHSTGENANQKSRLKDLRKQFLEKAKKKQKEDAMLQLGIVGLGGI